MTSPISKFSNCLFYRNMTPQHCSEVIEDFENAFENEKYCDVIIIAGEDPDIKELRANSFVLRVRCSYFERAFSNDWEEKNDDGNYVFKKPNIASEVFQLILRYLYTGLIDYENHNKEVILQCLIAADELGLNKLIEHIQIYLIDNEYLHIISEEPRILFSSEKFPSLEKPIITMILQRDDLNMEEIDIWDSFIRWLFVHYLKISKDDSSWSSEDLSNVKLALKEFIPLIRFYDISREDFYLKVYPYKDLLPQDLLSDILRYHMVPNSTPMLNFKSTRIRKVDSVLVNFNVFKLFMKWIEKKDNNYNGKIAPFQFILLLRGTRDGFDASKFHQLCDSKGATISFAKIQNSKQIIGGYNPLHWQQNSTYASTNDSFLFNIPNTDTLGSAKISRCSNPSNAVYYHPSYGPTFGNGHDLRAQGNVWYTSNGNAYPNINLSNNFTIDEYEVFKVVKKGNKS
ncbi:hypothetical protein GLOIN_2v1534759 [Rhizophagus irregularis DAOM 181602=DAOM 197198]|nr:hypothetical protein GLOIN_2v1534759 [Rhizophagus irregularis DAOM 181602=DAOM 197198]